MWYTLAKNPVNYSVKNVAESIYFFWYSRSFFFLFAEFVDQHTYNIQKAISQFSSQELVYFAQVYEKNFAILVLSNIVSHWPVSLDRNKFFMKELFREIIL